MKKNRLHRKFIQILIIPDDKSEPRNFSVPVNKLKWLKATAVILACHFLFGFFAYGQWYRIANSNRDLRQQNTQLKQTNKRIYELTSEFEKLESSQLKIRAALGLGNAERVNEAIVDNFVEPDFEDVVSPVTSPAPDSGLPERYREIKRLASELHEFDNKFPTLLPVEGFLTADYMDVSYSELDTHYGIDIAATRGKLVKAAADGLAIFSGWTHDLGYLLILYHGNGYFTYYGHNQRLMVRRGSFVSKGETIALVGSSGASSAPHLHFELWRDGVPLNPKNFILAFAQQGD